MLRMRITALLYPILPRRLSSCYKKLAFGFILLLVILAYVLFQRRRRTSSHIPVSLQPPAAKFVIPAVRNQSTEEGSFALTRIPKIIHQTWKTRDGIPETFRPWMESWIKLNPNWDYWFWTDEDMRVFISTVFPDYLSLYDSYPNQFYRVDAFRYFLLYVHGGIYADLDMECLQPLDEIAEKFDCVVSQEPVEHAHFLGETGPPLVSNALMACAPKHPFFDYVIRNLNSFTGFFIWTDILHATGPFMLTKVFKKYHHVSLFGFGEAAEKVMLASPEEFQPQPDDSMIDHMRKMCENSEGRSLSSESFAHLQKVLCSKLLSHDFGRRLSPTSFTNHHWTHTWAGKFHDPWGLHDMRIRFPVSDMLLLRRQ